MVSHRIGIAATLAVASLGLIGAGAGAQFTDATTVQQHVAAGTLDVRVSGAGSLSPGGKALALPAWGPTNSSFTTGPQPLTLTNRGTVAAHGVTVSAAAYPAAGAASAALAGQVCLRLVVASVVLYDGPLSAATHVSAALTIASSASAQATAEFYAGARTCPSLTAATQGGAITPTLDVQIHD